ASHWPSRSRTATASGTRRPAYFARIAAATTGSGSGHGTARIDTTHPILRPHEGVKRPHRHTGPQPGQHHGPAAACRELTTNINGGPKCRHDHRLKQQPGWKVDQLPDGTFRWTTPSGRDYLTEPTRYPI